jgi:hypothetical protein
MPVPTKKPVHAIPPVLVQHWDLYFERSFSRIRCLVEQIDKDFVVELAVAAHIGA